MADGRPIRIRAPDGRLLAATVHEPAPDTPKAPILVVPGATGVARGFYDRFAGHAASRGWRVLTFDYRGIGESLAPSRGEEDATMADWGRLDIEAALRWALGQGPRVHALCHSVGGQVLGLAPSASRLRRVCCVASQSGYWRLWGGAWRVRIALLWFGAIPALTRAMGSFPSHWFRLGMPLPKGVAKQWAWWGRHPGYIVGRHPDLRAAYEGMPWPMRLIHIADDHQIAPLGAVEGLAAMYGRTGIITTCHDVPMGHFGWFRAGREAIWDEALAWLASSPGDKH